MTLGTVPKKYQSIFGWMTVYNPYQNYVPQTQPADNGIVWVQGESGAKSYFVSAGKSVLLMDSEDSKFYIKSADVSGMPLPLRTFTYEEQKGSNSADNINTSNFITREEFEAKIAEITAKKGKKEVKTDE